MHDADSVGPNAGATRVCVDAPFRLRQGQRGVSDHLANGVALVGRHKAPPDARVQQPTAVIEVGAEQRMTRRTAIDRDS